MESPPELSALVTIVDESPAVIMNEDEPPAKRGKVIAPYKLDLNEQRAVDMRAFLPTRPTKAVVKYVNHNDRARLRTEERGHWAEVRFTASAAQTLNFNKNPNGTCWKSFYKGRETIWAILEFGHGVCLVGSLDKSTRQKSENSLDFRYSIAEYGTKDPDFLSATSLQLCRIENTRA